MPTRRKRCKGCGRLMPKQVSDTGDTKKKKKKTSAFAQFIQGMYSHPEVQKLPHNERFGKIADLWREHKAKYNL